MPDKKKIKSPDYIRNRITQQLSDYAESDPRIESDPEEKRKKKEEEERRVRRRKADEMEAGGSG